jgi:hypothetical protein
MAKILPKRGSGAPTTGLTENELVVDTTNKRIYIGNSGGGGNLIGSAPGGSNTQVQFNNTDNFGGSANFTFDGTNLQIGSQGDLRLADSDSSNYVAFQAPASVTNNNIYTLPSAVGSANQVLQIASVAGNDATLQWATVSGGGGTPGGSDTQVQFNDGGSTFGGDSGLTYNKSTDSLTIAGDLAINGGDLTSSASTFNLFSTGTASTTLNIATNSVGASNTKTLNIGTGGAGSSTTAISMGSNLGTSTVTMFGTTSIIGTSLNMYSSIASFDVITMGNAKGGRKGITVTADDPASFPVVMAIDNQDGGGEIDIYGYAAYDYTVGYIACDTPVFKAGDLLGNSNGYSIEFNDNTGIFTVGAYQLWLASSNSMIKFSDGSEQVTKTPDYLLFDMGIV